MNSLPMSQVHLTPPYYKRTSSDLLGSDRLQHFFLLKIIYTAITVRQFANAKDSYHASVVGWPTMHLKHFQRNSYEAVLTYTSYRSRALKNSFMKSSTILTLKPTVLFLWLPTKRSNRKPFFFQAVLPKKSTWKEG